MGLAAIFLSSVPEVRRARFEEAADLEDALARLVADGRDAWPEIALGDDDFAAFLGHSLPDTVANELASLRGAELWLVCAYALEIPGASAALEQHYLAREAAALARLGASPSMIDDVLQEIRQRLVEMRTQEPHRKGYAGRGSLGGWFRIAAVRSLNRRRERRARELMVGTAPVQVASPLHEPEMALLMKTYKRELTEAFQEALASMEHRDRSVLRYHFVEGLSIDRMGELYKVHRATAARWIARATETLSERTRESFRRRVTVSDESFQRIVGLIESQIAVGIAEAPGEAV